MLLGLSSERPLEPKADLRRKKGNWRILLFTLLAGGVSVEEVSVEKVSVEGVSVEKVSVEEEPAGAEAAPAPPTHTDGPWL